MAKLGLTLRIEQDLINSATPMNSKRCMMAQALRKQHGAWSIDVTADSMRFNIGEVRYMCATPAEAAVELVRFDHKKKVDPFVVHLRQLFSKPVRRIGSHKKRKHSASTTPKKAHCTIRRFHGLKVIEKANG